MANVQAGPFGLDMTSDIDFTDFPDADPTIANSTRVVFPGPNGSQVTVKGSNFHYDNPDSFPSTGTIESVEVTIAGTKLVSITKLSFSVADLRASLQADPSGQALAAMVFGGADRINGARDASNTLLGLGGADQLYGGTEADVLKGGDGADKLVGGRGKDVLTGDDGIDTFAFNSTSDSRSKSKADLITDLQNDDIISLRGIDAKESKDGNQAFVLVESFTGKEGQAVLAYDSDASKTFLSLDTDGDGSANAVIAMAGDHTDFTNFVL